MGERGLIPLNVCERSDLAGVGLVSGRGLVNHWLLQAFLTRTRKGIHGRHVGTDPCRGTSLIRKGTPLRPYRKLIYA